MVLQWSWRLCVRSDNLDYEGEVGWGDGRMQERERLRERESEWVRERGEDFDPCSLRRRSVVRNNDEESDKGGWECTAKRYWLCERWVWELFKKKERKKEREWERNSKREKEREWERRYGKCRTEKMFKARDKYTGNERTEWKKRGKELRWEVVK
jgi:hypothetical protein